MASPRTAERVRAALEGLAPTQEKVDRAVKTAIDVAHPSRIILFGSWARGEARWDSDLDLAVVLPDSAERSLPDLHRTLRQRLRQIPMTIDLVTFTEGQGDLFRDSINSIYYRILNDGKVAYDKRRAHAGSDPAIESR